MKETGKVSRRHGESRLQQQCVAWFRAQYPQYAMLLTHPANEGNGNRVSGAIHKAEGTVRGVPDLLLFVPSVFGTGVYEGLACHGLGIEMKTATGRQSQEQKDFQLAFETARYGYRIVRSLEEFREVVTGYLGRASPQTLGKIAAAHQEIARAAEERERRKFYKAIGKK